MHYLIKLQRIDGNGSLEAFLMKFQRMAAYLRWDDEDTFNHLRASLDVAAGHESSCINDFIVTPQSTMGYTRVASVFQ